MSADILRICDEVLAASRGITPLPWVGKNSFDIANGTDSEATTVAKCWSSSFAPPRIESKRNRDFLTIAANCAPALAEHIRRLHSVMEERNLFFNGETLQEKK